MMETITGRTPTGTEYTARAAGEVNGQATGFRSRMSFEVEVPEKSISFSGIYKEYDDAIMGHAMPPGEKRSRYVGVKVDDEVRAWIEAHEAPLREAEEREKARIAEIAGGLRREGHRIVSVDSLYRDGASDSGMYVNISSTLTGLPDNTQGKIGEFPVYLPHPDPRVSAHLLAGARDFSQAVEVFRERERTEREARLHAEEDAREKKAEHEAFKKARETGERAKIRSYTDDCNDRHEECSTDIVTVWAMPDGKTKTGRMHTW